MGLKLTHTKYFPFLVPTFHFDHQHYPNPTTKLVSSTKVEKYRLVSKSKQESSRIGWENTFPITGMTENIVLDERPHTVPGNAHPPLLTLYACYRQPDTVKTVWYYEVPVFFSVVSIETILPFVTGQSAASSFSLV